MIIKETPLYTEYKNSKKNCSFKINGRLQNGRIISKFMGWYLIGWFDNSETPLFSDSSKAFHKYKETVIRMTEVEIK